MIKQILKNQKMTEEQLQEKNSQEQKLQNHAVEWFEQHPEATNEEIENHLENISYDHQYSKVSDEFRRDVFDKKFNDATNKMNEKRQKLNEEKNQIGFPPVTGDDFEKLWGGK